MALRGRPAKRRRQVLEYVRDTVRHSGRAPSYREIGEALGIETAGNVRRIVVDLEHLGLLHRAGRSRVRRINLTV